MDPLCILDFTSPTVKRGCRTKVTKTLSRSVDSLLPFPFLDSCSRLPFFTANFSFILLPICYKCISLIHNKTDCSILDERLQCTKEHITCSISFNLPNRPMTLFRAINSHPSHCLHCITTMFHTLKCPNVG